MVFYAQNHIVCKSNSFTFSFSIWMPFFSFSCLIIWATTPRTMLTKSGESGRPCLIPDFRGKAFSFSRVSVILAEGVSYADFIMLRYFLSVAILSNVLVINGCCILSSAFSVSNDKII